MPAFERRDFSGIATTVTLGADITNTSLSITISSGTGWPTGGVGPFMIRIENEDIKCDSRTGTTLTVNASGRGYNSTSAVGHTAGVNVKHVHSVLDDNEANLAVNKTINKATAVGQMLLSDAVNSFAALDVKGTGKIIIGNGTTATSQSVSGDATLDGAGAVTVANNAVTNAKAADMATSRIKGRVTAATGDPEDLTAAQVKTLLALVGADITDFTEAVQDVMGNILVDSANVDWTYTDAANTLSAIVKLASLTQAEMLAGLTLLKAAAGAASGTTDRMWYDTTNNRMQVRDSSDVWQYSGQAGRAWTYLDEVFLGGAGTISFSSIPQTFTDLKIEGVVRGAPATPAASMRMRFNSLTTSIYSSHSMFLSGGTPSGSFTDSDTSADIGLVAHGSNAANIVSAVDLLIPSYTTASFKPWFSRTQVYESGVIGYTNQGSGQAGTTSAITSIQFSSGGSFTNNFALGSRLTLLGRR